MLSPRRTLQNLWERGTDALDEAADQYDAGDASAIETCYTARRTLHAAQRLATAMDNEQYPIESELDRLRRLESKVSAEPLDPDAPLAQLERLDDRINEGDAAFAADDHEQAAILYMQAFEIVDAFMAHSDTLSGTEEGICEMCREREATTTVEFGGRRIQACEPCQQEVKGRLQTEEALIQRREALRRDIQDALEWSPGADWLSTRHQALGATTNVTDPTEPSHRNLQEQDGEESDFDEVFLIREFARVSQRVGHPATPEEIDKHTEYSPDDYRAAFGEWDTVVDQAGFELPDESDEE